MRINIWYSIYEVMEGGEYHKVETSEQVQQGLLHEARVFIPETWPAWCGYILKYGNSSLK